ncbi:unnamed protein product [Closterium sp. Naga37s-1]|nr:unnamed protein product [Closterium sp. Naga37s-1]
MCSSLEGNGFTGSLPDFSLWTGSFATLSRSWHTLAPSSTWCLMRSALAIPHALCPCHTSCALPLPYPMRSALAIRHALCPCHTSCALPLPYLMRSVLAIPHALCPCHTSCALPLPYLMRSALAIPHTLCPCHTPCALPLPYLMRSALAIPHALCPCHISCALPLPYLMRSALAIPHALCACHTSCALPLPYLMRSALAIPHALCPCHTSCALFLPYLIRSALAIPHALCPCHTPCALPLPYLMRSALAIPHALCPCHTSCALPLPYLMRSTLAIPHALCPCHTSCALPLLYLMRSVLAIPHALCPCHTSCALPLPYLMRSALAIPHALCSCPCHTSYALPLPYLIRSALVIPHTLCPCRTSYALPLPYLIRSALAVPHTLCPCRTSCALPLPYLGSILDNNQLTETIPAAIFNMTYNLSVASILLPMRPSILPSILPSVLSSYLANNRLSGSLLSAISHLEKLQQIEGERVAQQGRQGEPLGQGDVHGSEMSHWGKGAGRLDVFSLAGQQQHRGPSAIRHLPAALAVAHVSGCGALGVAHVSGCGACEWVWRIDLSERQQPDVAYFADSVALINPVRACEPQLQQHGGGQRSPHQPRTQLLLRRRRALCRGLPGKGTRGSLTGNCLTLKRDVTCPSNATQRSTAACQAFCTITDNGPCDGRGACMPPTLDAPANFTCMCDVGYSSVDLGNGSTCAILNSTTTAVSSLSTGAIVSIVVGCFAGFTLLTAVLAWLLWPRGHSETANTAPMPSLHSYTSFPFALHPCPTHACTTTHPPCRPHFCILAAYITYHSNCADTPAQGLACAADSPQKTDAVCSAFCGVSPSSPACNGHGVCFLDGPSSTPTCICDENFVIGEYHGSCVSVTGGKTEQQQTPTKSMLTATGDATVDATPTLTLTPAQPSKAGSVFLAARVPLFSYQLIGDTCGRELAFSSSFSFTLTRAAASGSKGFAFVVAFDATPPTTPVVGGMGYVGMGARSVAVEFDTSKDAGNSDPDSNHVGINTGGSVTSVVTAKPSTPLNDGKPKHVWIKYDPSSSGSLLVFLSSKASPRPTIPLLSARISLCEELAPSPSEYTFAIGFTAASGTQAQSHVVSAWTLSTSERTHASFLVSHLLFLPCVFW